MRGEHMLKKDLIIIKKNKLPYIFFNSQIKSILAIISFSLVLSLIGYMIGDIMSFLTIKRFLLQPVILVLNTFPLTLFMLFLYFITSRIWCSYIFGGGFFIFIGLINRFKMTLREDPLIPADLILGNEVANIVKISELPISKYLALMLILFIMVAVLLVLFIKSNKLKLISRISGAAVCLLIFIFAFNTVYKNVKYFEQFPVVGTKYNSADVFRSRGFVYSFLVSFESLKVTKPDGYSKNKTEQLLKKYIVGDLKADQTKPNVIAIMGEAFFDFDRIRGVKFIDGNDPLKNFNEILKESSSGNIVTSVFGGGTASTELNFLTGYNTSLLPNGITPYKTHIRSNTYSIARFFRDNGYATMAFHPGYSWFYNRQNVYDYFGFENIIFRKDMNVFKLDLRRGYVKDRQVVDYILDSF
jgi:phosphoglycerol transferase MdoB-like AlkP superfamily enzyme